MKIKEGDRVVIVEDFQRGGRFLGKNAVVKYNKSRDSVFFEFERGVGGHSADGAGKHGHCYYGHEKKGKEIECDCGRCLICYARLVYTWRKL